MIYHTWREHTKHYTTRPGLEHVIYHTRRKHTKYYTTRPGLEHVIYHTWREHTTRSWTHDPITHEGSTLSITPYDQVLNTWSITHEGSTLTITPYDQVFNTWSITHEGSTLKHYTTDMVFALTGRNITRNITIFIPDWINSIEYLIYYGVVFNKLKKWCTQLAAASDKVYQLLAHDRWFSPSTPASSATKTGRQEIAEILLKVALNTKNQSSINYP